MPKKDPSTEGDSWPRKELFLFEPKTLAVIIIISVLVLIVSFFGEQGVKLMTNVLNPLPAHAPFDGTVYPVQQVLDWVHANAQERDKPLSQIDSSKLIPVPAYNPARLATPTANLSWNNPDHDKIRNEKITYSVPYLGAYTLNNLEYVGSHPAVDIKAPTGVAVHAIANGTVIKVKISGGGFGNHVLIQHNNVPTLSDPAQTTTLFSSYSHLNSISVNDRDVVVKGQVIGFVGQTGAATTPHLHFQIDADTAPFHPYWPFTTSDMQAAGYTFFEAINRGLNQDRARQFTIHPLAYVQKYLGEQNLVAVAPSPLPALPDPYESISFQIVGKDRVNEGESAEFFVQAFAQDGTLLSNPAFSDSVSLFVLNGQAELNKTTLSAADFATGIARNIVARNLPVGLNKLVLRFRNKEFSSNQITVEKKFSSVEIVLMLPEKRDLLINEGTRIAVRLLDSRLNKISDVDPASEFILGLTQPIGVLETLKLPAFRFVNGEANVLFTPSVPGSTSIVALDRGRRYESPLITVVDPAPVGTSTPPDSALGRPVDVGTSTPVERQDQGTSAEALGTSTTPTSDLTAPPNAAPPDPGSSTPSAPGPPLEPTTNFPDAPAGTSTDAIVGSSTAEKQFIFIDISEESPYFQILKNLKNASLIAGYGDGSFRPENSVSRAESVAMILRALNEEVRATHTSRFPDVGREAWYFNFILTASDLGFVKGHSDGRFRPDAPVTLAEFFTMLFEAARVDIDPLIQLALPGEFDAAAWYAPYIQEAMRKNVIDVFEGYKLRPDYPLTRGEIAKVIYKLRTLEGSAL